MMLQMPPGALPPGLRRSSARPSQGAPGRLCDNAELRAALDGGGGVLGTAVAIQGFDDIEPGPVPAGSLRLLSASIIVAGRSDVMVEQTDDGNVLTGMRGASNDCRLIFRHAYGRVRCELRTMTTSADTHLGFLDHRRFDEVQTFSIGRPRSLHGECRGALWATLEFRAEPLCEVQGIVWRGGLLQIRRITLTP